MADTVGEGSTAKRPIKDDEDENLDPGSSSAKRARTFKPGEWIFQQEVYRAWEEAAQTTNTSSKTLWVHGPPGSGKSFLSRTVADRLQNSPDQRPIASYLCEEASSASKIVESILVQLARHPRTPQADKETLSNSINTLTKRNNHNLTPAEAAWDVFTSAVNNISACLLVLDGIDELKPQLLNENGFNFAKNLRELQQNHNGVVKLFLSSEDVVVIRDAFKESPALELTLGKLNDDLEVFTADLVDGHSNLIPYKNDIVKDLVELGNFTSIYIAVQCLSNGSTGSGVEDQLSIFHSIDLRGMYVELFDKQYPTLSWADRDLRDSILRWVANAIRPLSISELASFCTVSTNSFVQDFETKAVQVCNHLVKVDGERLVPVHHSLLIFLRSDHRVALSRLHKVRGEAGHLSMAIACLRYLTHPNFAVAAMNPDPNLGLEANSPILEYAVLYWVYHVSQAERASAELQSLVMAFFASPVAFFWIDRLLPQFLYRSVLPIPPRPKHAARFMYIFGLKSQIAKLFQDESSKEELDRIWMETLHRGYEDALREAKAEFGEKHAQVVERTLDLAEVCDWLPGLRARSGRLFQEAYNLAMDLNLSEATSPADVALGLATSQAFADSEKRAGKYAHARDILNKLLPEISAQAVASERDTMLMYALDGLGWVCMKLGRLDEAASHLKEALDIATKLHGSTSSLTLRSKVTQAEIMVELGRSDEAMGLCQQLIRQLEEWQQGEGIPIPSDSISHLNTLANVFMAEHKFAEAAQTFSAVVKNRSETFGIDHPITLWATMMLGLAMEKADADPREVMTLFNDLIPRQEKALGAQHPDVDTSRKALVRAQTIVA
ncbi:hypothetical protein B0A52_07116 [Exophiala mesophila]|uniref:Uncharacterized protein n=1 Tax=Exophiala mesophila TaxID=212818 RepID=A0A438MZM1_EXOME|nr:hypothetical protein B0A52_07116 [Exophiala mesophila]